MRLPNAPLVEAVFELRWDVVESSPGGQPFGFDPGLFGLLLALDERLAAEGFTDIELFGTNQPSMVHSITRRYRKKGASFPLFQVGHGVFAFNISTEYEWSQFKADVIYYLQLLIECYPKIDRWSFSPTRSELRYVDVFNRQLANGESFSSFVTTVWDARLEFPVLSSGLFDGSTTGHLRLIRALASDKASIFSFDAGDGKAADEEGILMTTKVTRDIALEEWRGNEVLLCSSWLDVAHAATSAFFSGLVRPEIMTKFGAKS